MPGPPANTPERLAADQEEAARVMQEVLRVAAAARCYVAGRVAFAKGIRAASEEVLARLQRATARAQSLVRFSLV